MKSYLPVLFNKPAKRGGRAKAGESSAITTYLVVFAVCGVLLLVGLTKIYLERGTVQFSQTRRQKNEDLKVVLMERQNLIIDREHFMSGEHIIKYALVMGLRPSEPGQVRKMPRRRNRLSAERQTVADQDQ